MTGIHGRAGGDAGQLASRVLDRLKRVKRAGPSSWMALCPAHDDRNPSLSIAEGRDGRVLLTCHAGCARRAIVEAMGLTMSDLFPPDPARAMSSAPTNRNGASSSSETSVLPLQRPVFEKSYDYVDENGALLFQVCRFRDQVSGKKQFRQRHRVDGGDWVWNRGDARLVLYKLPELLEAIACGKPVCIVEGEKDVETLAELGYVATTNAGGAGKWSEEHSALFADADVIIIPDNDDAGRSHAGQVGASLTAAGARVRVLELPELPPKGDVTDWMATHDGPELAAAIDAAPAWEPPSATGLPRAIRAKDVRDAEPIRWVVEDLLPAGELAVFAGVGGSLKSTCALHTAAAVAAGNSVFNRFPTAPGPVLVVSAEDPDTVMKNRLEAITEGHGWDRDVVLSNVHLMASHEAKLSDPLWQTHLLDEAQRLGVGLIVLDPWADLITGDENSNSEQRPVIQFCRRLTTTTGAAVLVVAHVKKMGENQRPIDSIRGATALRDASRSLLLLEERPEGISVQHLKMSRSEKLAPFVVTREIESSAESRAIWTSARFGYQTVRDAVQELVDEFVLTAIRMAPGELNSTMLRQAAAKQKYSREHVAQAQSRLRAAGLITYHEGERNARWWVPTDAGLLFDVDAARACRAESGKLGKLENEPAEPAESLPGKLQRGAGASAHPAPPSGGQGRVGGGSAGRRRQAGRFAGDDDEDTSRPSRPPKPAAEPPEIEELEL